MAITIKHAFQSQKADGLDTTIVQPSNWNDNHTIEMATGKILGRMTSGTGVVQELPVVVDPTGQSVRPPQGTTAQRPSSASAGMIRYNTTTGQLEAYQNGAWGNFSDIAMSPMDAGTVKGRALGSGTGAPANLTRAQLQRLIYNVGTGYITFNAEADDGFVFPFGQNLSRATYSELFAKYGTTYGPGNGTTTFTMPDLRGRTLVGKDNMGGASAGRLTSALSGISGATLGAAGGVQSVTLTEAQIPAHTHAGTTGIESNGHTHSTYMNLNSRYGMNGAGRRTAWCGADRNEGNDASTFTSYDQSASHTHDFVTSERGGSEAHGNVQPSIVCNIQIYTGVHA